MDKPQNEDKKIVRIFIDEGDDEKRVFESIRMALGITLRGHKVILCLSEKSEKLIKSMNDSMRREVEEFIDSIPLMGGEVRYMKFEDFIKYDGEYDFFVI